MEEGSWKKPRWLPLGKGFSPLKLYFHPSQSTEFRVKFELRRVLDELKDEPVKTNICIKENKETWDPIFRLFGCNRNPGIIPSSKSWTTLHNSHPPDHILSEYQVEIWATVCIIAHQASSSRQLASRERAFSLLEQLLRATAGVVGDGDSWDAMSFYQLSDSVRQKAEECEQAQCGHRFGCHHLQRILSDAMDSKMSDGANVLAKIIVSCMKAKRCAAAVAQLVDMTSKLETILSENFDDIGIDDPLSENTDLRASKRRRLDKERKSALMHWAINEKKGKTIKSLCVSRGEAGADNSSKWLREEMGPYQWCLWFLFQDVQALAVAFDASRVGMPREETLSIAGCRVETELAAWFMPQVEVCKTLGGLHRFEHPHVCPEVTYPSVKLFSWRAPAAFERVMKFCLKIA